jgi:hypothetical protein
MAQRISGYQRVADEGYHTVLAWPAAALLAHLPDAAPAWDFAAGDGHLVANLNALGVETIGTTDDFLARREPPPDIRSGISNPPYGEQRRGEKAVAFIRHALNLELPIIAFLLPIDFDSAVTRQDVFRHCQTFHAKVVLLGRIVWFQDPNRRNNPSTNHSWYLWRKDHHGPPIIRYSAKAEFSVGGRGDRCERKPNGGAP